LISDTTVLLTKYVINIFKQQIYQKNSESEFVKEIILDEEPNDEHDYISYGSKRCE